MVKIDHNRPELRLRDNLKKILIQQNKIPNYYRDEGPEILLDLPGVKELLQSMLEYSIYEQHFFSMFFASNAKKRTLNREKKYNYLRSTIRAFLFLIIKAKIQKDFKLESGYEAVLEAILKNLINEKGHLSDVFSRALREEFENLDEFCSDVRNLSSLKMHSRANVPPVT